MLEVLYAVTGESIGVFEKTDFAEGSVTVKALKQRLAQKIGIPRFNYGSFKTIANWMISKPWPRTRRWPFKLYSFWSRSIFRLTGSKIRASWWHVWKIMPFCLRITWTSHEIPTLKMHVERHPWDRQPATEVSYAYLYWLSPVPTKTKARQMLEQHLCT